MSGTLRPLYHAAGIPLMQFSGWPPPVSGISDNTRIMGFKVVLAATLAFAQLAASAHTHHEHSDDDGPDSLAECTTCIVKSSSDEEGDLSATNPPLAVTLGLSSPTAVATRGDPSASPVRGIRTARGPPLS